MNKECNLIGTPVGYFLGPVFIWKCSNCNESPIGAFQIPNKIKYCSYCGARVIEVIKKNED